MSTLVHCNIQIDPNITSHHIHISSLSFRDLGSTISLYPAVRQVSLHSVIVARFRGQLLFSSEPLMLRSYLLLCHCRAKCLRGCANNMCTLPLATHALTATCDVLVVLDIMFVK